MSNINKQSTSEKFGEKARRWGVYSTIVPQFRQNAQPAFEQSPVLSRAYNMNSWS